MNPIDRYVGNPKAYAIQRPDGKGYTPVREPLTEELLEQHLQGVETLGTYVLNFDKAHYFVFDIDDGSRATANALVVACRALGFRPGIEYSGRKGYHVWVLLDGWKPAVDVRLVARYIARTVGFNGELFPKQDVASDLGNLIKLPQGVHKATGRRSRWVGLRPAVATQDVFAGALDQARRASPPPAKSSFGPLPCLESIQQDPAVDGERNDLMFHFAAHMRRAGLEGDQLDSACDALNDSFKPPLRDNELYSIIRNTEDRGPLCGQLSDKRHCGNKCITVSRRGLQVRPGQARGAADGEYLVVETHRLADGTLLLDHPDFQVPPGVRFKR